MTSLFFAHDPPSRNHCTINAQNGVEGVVLGRMSSKMRLLIDDLRIEATSGNGREIATLRLRLGRLSRGRRLPRRSLLRSDLLAMTDSAVQPGRRMNHHSDFPSLRSGRHSQGWVHLWSFPAACIGGATRGLWFTNLARPEHCFESKINLATW